MKDYIDIFKVYLLDEKKSSGNTVESYIRDINQLVTYCASKNVLDMAQFTNGEFKTYLPCFISSGGLIPIEETCLPV